ncbi:MAG: hypothetical protein ACE5R7_00580 [Nitrosarchaeum sp.]
MIIVFSIILLIDYGFLKIPDTIYLENVRTISDIIFGVIIFALILDLFLKYRKSKDFRTFLKKNWFDIITLVLIPVFSTMKLLKLMISLIKKLKIIKMLGKIIYKSKKLSLFF